MTQIRSLGRQDLQTNCAIFRLEDPKAQRSQEVLNRRRALLHPLLQGVKGVSQLRGHLIKGAGKGLEFPKAANLHLLVELTPGHRGTGGIQAQDR